MNDLRVEIYTDGACKGNPGPGGWGVVLKYGGHEKELSGGDPMTTNNRMELKAAIEGIRAIKKAVEIDIYTDSTYVRDGITKWIHSWKVKGWKNSQKEPVKNADLWQELDQLASSHKISWHWVKGHSDHPENDRADELAHNAAVKLVG